MKTKYGELFKVPPYFRESWRVATILCLLSTLLPAYIVPHTLQGTTIYGVAMARPWLWVVPLTFAAAIYFSTVRKPRFLLYSMFAEVVGIVCAALANANDPSGIPTPQPSTAVVQVLYIFVVPLFIYWPILMASYRLTKRRTARRHNVSADLPYKEYRKAILEARADKRRVVTAEELRTNKRPEYTRGAIFALGGPVIGIVVWLLLWQMGIAASFSAYVMARTTVWLWQKGSRSTLIDNEVVVIVASYTVCGLALAFCAGLTSDLIRAVLAQAPHTNLSRLLSYHVFWRQDLALIFSLDTMRAYAGSLITGTILSAIGLYGIFVKTLLPASRATAAARFAGTVATNKEDK